MKKRECPLPLEIQRDAENGQAGHVAIWREIHEAREIAAAHRVEIRIIGGLVLGILLKLMMG